jgi:PIN domain nuclease of toxin-antitoxin system
MRALFGSSDAELCSSVASLWEIAIKVRLGKLPLRHPLKVLPELLDSLSMQTLTIETRHVLAELYPEPDTRDPFDRLLLAQCSVEKLLLVTQDRALVSHPLAWRPMD